MSLSISVVVVDDEPLARARLERFVNAMPDVDLLAVGVNGQEAIELTQQHSPDVLLLDIEMPNMTGLEAAKLILEKVSEPPAIIFCTAYDEYALEAFSTWAVAYLLKPIDYNDLNSAILKAQRLSRLQLNHIESAGIDEQQINLGQDGYLSKLPVTDLLYFRVEGKSVVAGLMDGKEVVVDYTLKALEESLVKGFVRVHRSSLISKRSLKELISRDDGHKEITLHHTDLVFQVSRRHLKKVKEAFNDKL